MQKVKLLFALLLFSIFLLILSCCGLLMSDNSLYILAIFLSSTAIIFISYALYELKYLQDLKARPEYHFYFIDSSPESQDLFSQHLNIRR